MKTTIKKTIALLMISLGFIIMLADSDGGFIATLIIKMAGIIVFFLGVQLCATWKLFGNYLNND